MLHLSEEVINDIVEDIDVYDYAECLVLAETDEELTEGEFQDRVEAKQDALIELIKAKLMELVPPC